MPTYDPTSLIAGDFPLKTRNVTVPAGNVFPRGTVLGRITANKKYVKSLTASADGSQTPKAVAACDVDTTGADKVVPVYVTGEFAQEKLTYGAGHDAASVEDAFTTADILIFLRKVGAVA